MSDQSTEGKKFDGGKVRLDLLPWDSLTAVAEVLTFGANKYEEDGWKNVPNAYKRYTAAQLRHHAAAELGEEVDTESGLPHLAHEACNALFRLHFYLEENKNAFPD